MKTLICFCILLLVASAAVADDVNVAGKWSGKFLMDNGDGIVHDSTAFLILKQEGAEISGTLGPTEAEQFPIQKGKVEGDKITLEVQTDGPLVKFELVLSEDHLKGDAHASADGHNLSAKLDTTRVK
jgi:hypothetical protein